MCGVRGENLLGGVRAPSPESSVSPPLAKFTSLKIQVLSQTHQGSGWHHLFGIRIPWSSPYLKKEHTHTHTIQFHDDSTECTKNTGLLHLPRSVFFSGHLGTLGIQFIDGGEAALILEASWRTSFSGSHPTHSVLPRCDPGPSYGGVRGLQSLGFEAPRVVWSL